MNVTPPEPPKMELVKGDGWGENGFLLGFFIGEPKEVYIDNFYQVKKAYEHKSLDWHWEKV